jgi:bifunctional non-homologous end joining protein LigD
MARTKAEDLLSAYRSKRDFSKTPEPAPERRRKTGISFVIQKHAARRTHFDFRLEHDGVLKSWAVTRGPSLDPTEKRLAVRTEDHPLEYGSFEGTIPEGEYGAGTVTIWDSGTYDTKHWDDRKIEVMLHGRRLNGAYVLVKFGRAGKNDWLLFRAA